MAVAEECIVRRRQYIVQAIGFCAPYFERKAPLVASLVGFGFNLNPTAGQPVVKQYGTYKRHSVMNAQF